MTRALRRLCSSFLLLVASPPRLNHAGPGCSGAMVPQENLPRQLKKVIPVPTLESEAIFLVSVADRNRNNVSCTRKTGGVSYCISNRALRVSNE